MHCAVWSFQFLEYTRLGPRTKLAPLKPAAGSASVAIVSQLKRAYTPKLPHENIFTLI